MQDWTNIIKKSEKQKLITPKEATELHAEHVRCKTAFAAGKAVKTTFRSKIFGKMKSVIGEKIAPRVRWLAENPTYIVLGALAADMAGATGKAFTAPLRSKINYTSMKEELERISPGITKKHDDVHIKRIYSAIMRITPSIAGNPLVAAVLVRDNIDMPQAMNYAHIQSLSQIQSNMTKKETSSGAFRQVATSFAGPAIKGVADAYTKELTDKIIKKRVDEKLLKNQ